jgi:hypothetical protein
MQITGHRKYVNKDMILQLAYKELTNSLFMRFIMLFILFFILNGVESSNAENSDKRTHS